MKKRSLILFALITFMGVLRVNALSFIKYESNYHCTVAGKNVLQFSLPTYDYYTILTDVHIVQPSWVAASIDGGNTWKNIIEWYHGGLDRNGPTSMRTLAPGELIVQMTRYGKSNVSIKAENGWVNYVLGHDADDDKHYTTTVQWKVPYEWQGKTIKLKFQARWADEFDGYVRGNFDEFESIAPPAVKVNMMDPMLAFDRTHVGETMIPFYIQATECKGLKVHYTNSNTNVETVTTVDPSLGGNVYVPMTDPLQNVYLEADIIDSDKNELKGITSEPITVNMFHVCKELQAEMQDDATVKLAWKVDNPLMDDIQPDDYWEIQRNMTGEMGSNDPQWTTIQMLPFETGTENYEFVDEDVKDFYQDKDIVYRIRRSSAAVWDWAVGDGSMTNVVNTRLSLPLFVNATVKKETWNDDEHTVTFNWEIYKDNQGLIVEGFGDQSNLMIGSFVDANGIYYSDMSEAQAAGVTPAGIVLSLNPAVVMSLNWVNSPYEKKYFPMSSDYIFAKSSWTKDTYSDEFLDNSIHGYSLVYPYYKIWNYILSSLGDDNGRDDDYEPVDGDSFVFDKTADFLKEKLGKDLPETLYLAGEGDKEYFFNFDEKVINQKEEYFNIYDTEEEAQNADRTAAALYMLHGVQMWDERAKLLLYVHMDTGSGQYTEIVDITTDDNAIKNQTYTYHLTRKCVDYSFELVEKRGSSPLAIYGTKANADGTYPDSISVQVAKMETGDDAKYWFLNTDRVINLQCTTRQSSVLLEWETTGGERDFFRILRRDKMGEPDDWETIVTDYSLMMYEDKTVQPQHEYEYRVESVFQCEGSIVNDATISGSCEPTGMVRGFLRLADGTGMGGYTVKAVPKDIEGAETKTAVTDDSGFYEIGGLVYHEIGQYDIMVETDGGSFTIEPQRVTFDTTSNLKTNVIFYVDLYYVYSGNIYYEGSSIPVPGVEFKMDGNTVTDGNGNPYQTDSQGAFELSIPKGVHQVQAVKDGHVFKNEGFLLNPDAPKGKERDWNWNANKAEVYLWDQTEVVLHGRVIGGDKQGALDLGHSLSKNNLGDSIKIVMQLEGDNTSWIVRDQLDETVKTRTETFNFGKDNKNTTVVNSTRHTITVNVDNETGEYEMKLHPAKYKITEINATGYATLFQDGKVGETLDLSFNQQGDTAVYSRIYHSQPTLDVNQPNPSNEKYFGLKRYVAQDNVGNKDTVRVWNTEDGSYSLGHPVFMGGSSYGWILKACEKYYYNNDIHAIPDTVNLNSGTVVIRNRLVSENDETTLELDETGISTYTFTPANTVFNLQDDNALRIVGITLEYDNTFYDVKPFNGEQIKGYVMATEPKPNGKIVMTSGIPLLFDILRDPPGGGSSAYIEQGSKLNYAYNIVFDAQAGVNIVAQTGTKYSYYTGTVVVPSFGATGVTYGTVDGASKKSNFALDIIMKFGLNWTINYGLDVTERIQTSSSKKWVGPKADLFIGANTNVILQDAVSVRVVPESQYNILSMQEGGTFQTEDGKTFTIKNGAVKKLAEGKDANGNKVFLVRDETMGVSSQVKSTFIHSQHYIENELIPQLIKARNSLIFPVGSTAQAQALADKDGIPYYVSKVDRTNPQFGNEYEMVCPTGKSKEECIDSISSINQQIIHWVKFLAQNEEEKLGVSDDYLVKNYDFDGATTIQYSESFTAGKNMTMYLKWPIIGNYGLGINTLEGLVGSTLEKLLDKVTTDGKQTAMGQVADDSDDLQVINVGSPGTEYTLKLLPVLNFNYDSKNTESSSSTKKIGFTLSASSKSNLNVDVYRTKKNIYDLDSLSIDSLYDPDDYFYDLTDEALRAIWVGSTSSLKYKMNTTNVYSSFVYRTRGGVTNQPYEDERVTKWFKEGEVLDAKTKPIDNPRIWAEQTTVSNVPFDEPARFTIHMANESDYADRATSSFNYALDDNSNPKGAKVYIDGNVLNGAGTYVNVGAAGSVLTKQLEVYPNSDFDYEDLGITLYDPEDGSRSQTVYLTAHFVPTAGKVHISTPGDKWVINTESSYDNQQKKYYMPVSIDGFDVNYRGFDHVELQYKLSTQGDKDWVNVCSYYHDKELMAKASGVCDTIPSNGTIVAPFYGENDPIEQYYDIRAVVYCRHGNGFLTASSDILSGIKDTRCPEVFGTPQPVNGILGIGDDIIVNFSEQIAGNYLSKANNFEVLGTPISNDISLSTSLGFNGATAASSISHCNLAGKDFTVDVMLDPDDNDKQMMVFAHGGDAKGLRLGLTADRKLIASVNDQTVISDKAIDFYGLHQVAYTFKQDSDRMTVAFYDGNNKIGQKTVKSVYDGDSYIVLGTSKSISADGDLEWNDYEGDMLELRIWNRCLSDAEMGKYSQKVLTGYEHGLISYYRLNEGKGDYSYDQAASANDMRLLGHVWNRPPGLSMKIGGKEGIKLVPDRFERTEHEDYTLMFWFRSEKPDGTLFANGEARDELKAEDHFNIGLRNAQVFFRSNGYEVVLPDTVTLSSWHHFAMTVQRSRNVANIYLDNKPYAAFPADSVGAISGNGLALGATYDNDGNCTDVMKGNLDEVGLFASALPVNLIKGYSTALPSGKEMSLLAYLDFGQSKNQDDNTQRLEPTGVSLKLYIDSQGKVIEVKRDTIIAQATVEAHADRTSYAPMTRSSQLDNIKYSFAADGNKLLVNLDVPDAQIEKTNIYVTVRDVADLNGNLMKSPLTMNVYAYRNPLRWSVQHVSQVINYGDGYSFTAKVQNLSGQSKYFEIKDLPIWISASMTAGTIDALDEEEITFTVSPYINIGHYNEIISLVGNDDMSESLKVTLKVCGEAPEWEVSESLKKKNIMMQVIARVQIDGVIATDPEDILAVMGDDQEIHGLAHIDVDNTANALDALAYLVIYGTENMTDNLHYLFYDASTGQIHRLETLNEDALKFNRNSIIGTADNPVLLVNSFTEVATLDLASGWNWVSFNAVPLQPLTVGELLYGSANWEPNDVFELVSGTTAVKYFCVPDKSNRGYKWSQDFKTVEINPTLMYRIYSKNPKKAYIGGSPCYQVPVKVNKGWNRIAYLSPINLPIAQAMSDYVSDATEGDVLKSQDAFSILSRDGSGNLIWRGSLKYMETGKGYMLKRNKKDESSFTYPLYFSDNRYNGNTDVAPRRNANATTMNIVAEVVGVETAPGDSLVAYSGAERCGVAIADYDGVFYLNVGAEENQNDNITFCIERGGDVIALTRSKISYVADKVLGSPEIPTKIDFAAIEEFAADGEWYTVSGIKLSEKPKQQGIYVHDGKAIFIK